MQSNDPATKSTNKSIGLPSELVQLAAAAIVIHALILYFIFPGYYNPLWPHHSDFYIPVALAHSDLGYADYLQFPRIVGTIFFDAIGSLGVRGGILAVIIVVLLNCVLTAALFRRLVGINLDWRFIVAFVAYIFLVFSHPHFYTFSTWDAFSQLSYLLLLAAVWSLIQYNHSSRTVFLDLFTALMLFSFLAKETYGVSALFLAAGWFLFKRKDDALRATIPILIVGTTLVVALLINSMNNSPFTSDTGSESSTYRMVLAPMSLIYECIRYASDGLNGLTAALISMCVVSGFVFMRTNKSIRWLVLLLPLAGALAWLPNAALPNHYYPGYSWNGAYLLFTPVLLVASLWQAGRLARVSSVVLVVLVLSSPLLFVNSYKSNAWILEQETRQRNLIQAINGLTKSLPTDSTSLRVLVTGIDFPFSPFEHGLSMLSFHQDDNVQYDVLAYVPRLKGIAAFPLLESRPSGVHFIASTEIDFLRYQRVLAFRSDGTLVKDVSDPHYFASQQNTVAGFNAVDMLLYPRLFDIFGDPAAHNTDRKELNGYDYLACGTALLGYENSVGAERCLLQSTQLIPRNPYPYFYLGNLHNKHGKSDLARSSYERAIALDDPVSPNPWFRVALEKISKSARSSDK